jgi:hypothetical protein
MNLKETEWDDVRDSFVSVYDQWRAIGDTIMKFWIPYNVGCSCLAERLPAF